MFRKHAALLNTVPQLGVLICDEGHRLKNVGGTKTIQALTNCRARRRIVLSGTPVQNDLDELFAVVSFVQPGFFGSLSSFKQDISGPIVRGSEPDATEHQREQGEAASSRLRELMSSLMLRRTQTDILSKSLPPRTDFVVYCGMTRAQREEYEHIVQKINVFVVLLLSGALMRSISDSSVCCFQVHRRYLWRVSRGRGGRGRQVCGEFRGRATRSPDAAQGVHLQRGCTVSGGECATCC